MPATNQDIKDFFALSGNNPAVTNGQLTKLQAYLDDQLSKACTDACDVVDFCYSFLRQGVEAHKDSITIAPW